MQKTTIGNIDPELLKLYNKAKLKHQFETQDPNLDNNGFLKFLLVNFAQKRTKT